jgi:hypothetical protein
VLAHQQQAAPAPAEAKRPLYRGPWLWAALGALVIGTAAVVVAAAPRGERTWNCGADCNLSTVHLP